MSVRRILVASAAALIMTSSHAVFAADAPAKKSGDMLVNPAGMTLYVFDKDAPASGKSVCNAQCATNWPPLMASGDAKPAGEWSVVTRDDGTKQWAYKGRPLYQWSKDQKPGDKGGDGIGGMWHVAND
ncbi:MAG: COG4315 family predicted lipoprotein [Burkholderiales bacterium]